MRKIQCATRMGAMHFVIFLALFLGFQNEPASCRTRTPHTPCPRLFNYYESATYGVIGAMTLKNDLSGEYNLEVAMSIPIETDKNIRLLQNTPTWKVQNGDDIQFYVLFPFNHTYPQLTSITFNGKVFCTGPAAGGSKVTPLKTSLKVVAPLVDSLKPETPAPAPAPTPAPAPPPAPAPAPASTPDKPATTNVNIQININNKNFEECGVNVDYQPFIIGGNSTRDGEYPWLVALFVYSNYMYNFNCAGSLVSNRHVLTAAHCLQDLQGRKTNIEDMLVVLGSRSIQNWARRGITRGIKRAAVHREYTKPADADLAIVVLDEPVQFSLTIRPICLWSESDSLDQIVSQVGIVAGWGRDEEDNTFLTEPRQVMMPVVTQEACLRSDERFFTLSTQRTFCAGDRKGSTPCTGDSGGGFIMKRNRKWTLRGIVSVGLLRPASQVCDSKQYTVFSDVSKFSNWIAEQMAKP